MARTRGRSPRLWFWTTFIVGPFGPLALACLGIGQHLIKIINRTELNPNFPQMLRMRLSATP